LLQPYSSMSLALSSGVPLNGEIEPSKAFGIGKKRVIRPVPSPIASRRGVRFSPLIVTEFSHQLGIGVIGYGTMLWIKLKKVKLRFYSKTRSWHFWHIPEI
jgi:hypothetical protein